MSEADTGGRQVQQRTLLVLSGHIVFGASQGKRMSRMSSLTVFTAEVVPEEKSKCLSDLGRATEI